MIRLCESSLALLLIMMQNVFRIWLFWNSSKNSITEPPLTMRFCKRNLIAMVENYTFDFGDYPNHTQAVERMVKLVTLSSLKHIGHEKRHYFILNSLNALKQA